MAQYAQSSLGSADLSAPSLGGLLSLLDDMTKNAVFSLVRDNLTALMPELFVFANVLPTIRATDTQHRVAGDIFLRCFQKLPEDSRSHVTAVVQQRLQDILLDCSVPIR